MAHRPRPYRPFGQTATRHSGPRPEWRRLYGRRWNKYTKSFLALHPLCVYCALRNRDEPATVVDHVIPHKGDVTLFWDVDNHQALCKRCHDRKTVLTDGGFGRNTSR